MTPIFFQKYNKSRDTKFLDKPVMQDDEVIRAHHDQDSSKGTVFSVQLLLPSQFSNPLRRKTNSTILLVSP